MSGRQRRQFIEAACELVVEVDRGVRTLRARKGGYRRIHQDLGGGTTVERGMIAFDARDCRIIHHWLTDRGIDPERGRADEARSRTDLAVYQVDEKTGSAPVAAEAGLMALAPAGPVSASINGIELATPAGSFVVTRAGRIGLVSADWMLTVENFDTFLRVLAEPGRLGVLNGGGLVILRTAPTYPAGMTLARQARERWGLAHRYAPDVDHQGISHALESELDGVWIPSIDALNASEAVNADLFERQHRVADRLAERARSVAPALVPWVEFVEDRRGGITQERCR